MNTNLPDGIKFKYNKIIVRVWYYNSSDPGRKVLIKSVLNDKKNNYAYIQFYGEFKPRHEKKWIIDNEPNRINPPYYSIIGPESTWKDKWSDQPLYDLGSIGTIIFNTILAKVDKASSQDPKVWRYNILFGFSWGLKSKNGLNINAIPIKKLPLQRLKILLCLLKCYYPEGDFTLCKTSGTYKIDKDTKGRW